MSRWIDADAIKRQVECNYTEYPVMIKIRRAICEMMDDAPSIDIVSCMYCKHYQIDNDSGVYGCMKGLHNVCDKDFCSYGERKSDLPTIDLVRCKDCVNKDEIVNYCHEMDRNINADDFCSYGERKE